MAVIVNLAAVALAKELLAAKDLSKAEIRQQLFYKFYLNEADAEQCIDQAQQPAPEPVNNTVPESVNSGVIAEAQAAALLPTAMSDDELLQEFLRIDARRDWSETEEDYRDALQVEIERRQLTVPYEDDEESKESDSPHDVMGTFEHAPRRRLSPEEKEAELIAEWKKSLWWLTFKGADELEDGDGIRMYINHFIPEGVTILASLPKEGKTWLALSICKALTSGQPLFGKAGFEVPEPVPVIYMAAEVSERALKHRIKKFQITDDKTKFLCRTVSSNGAAGNMDLNDRSLLEAIKAMKPIIVLDVLQCFSDSEDENDAAENKNLRRTIDGLRGRGARAVIVLHHSTKNFKSKPTKENSVRGSGDILAMVDCVWALMLDDRLCQSTNIEEVDVMGWGRDFSPVPFRFALTRRATPKDGETYRDGVVSVLDTDHDLVFVEKNSRHTAAEVADQATADYLENLVRENPTITLKDLASKTGQTYWTVRNSLTERGWSKPAGRTKKGQAHLWMKQQTAAA
jgi:AAA domain